MTVASAALLRRRRFNVIGANPLERSTSSWGWGEYKVLMLDTLNRSSEVFTLLPIIFGLVTYSADVTRLENDLQKSFWHIFTKVF